METLTITKENFDSEVIKSDRPVLLDFWAPGCSVCQRVSPVVDEIANEATNFKVGKINIDEQQDLAAAHYIKKVPTFAVVKDGRFKKTIVGARPKATILEMLNS